MVEHASNVSEQQLVLTQLKGNIEVDFPNISPENLTKQLGYYWFVKHDQMKWLQSAYDGDIEAFISDLNLSKANGHISTSIETAESLKVEAGAEAFLADVLSYLADSDMLVSSPVEGIEGLYVPVNELQLFFVAGSHHRFNQNTFVEMIRTFLARHENKGICFARDIFLDGVDPKEQFLDLDSLPLVISIAYTEQLLNFEYDKVDQGVAQLIQRDSLQSQGTTLALIDVESKKPKSHRPKDTSELTWVLVNGEWVPRIHETNEPL